MYLSVFTKNQFDITLKSILITLFTVVSVFAYPAEKRALIVAIGAYPANSGWNEISSVNDAVLMRTILQKQGFEDKNITTLTEARATKANILKSLESLIAQSNQNDVVVFHFSGHGQQITDTNGDELDGYDEALIPFDAQKSSSTQYKGSRHLLDDELNGLLYRLRKKVGSGGDVIFFLDACHSGTATRGQVDAICRGTNEKFDITPPNKIKSADGKQQFDEQVSNSERVASELSPFAIFSASGQQELNMEIKDPNNTGYGSLTYALGKILATNHEELIYSALFDRMCNEMWANFGGRHQQTPQLEGQAERMLFAGQSVAVPLHCSVVSVINSKNVIVNMGELSGLTIGSELSFYPINTINPEKAKLLAKGIVKELGPIESKIEMTSPFDKSQLQDSWGFVTKTQLTKAYADESTRRAAILRRVSAEAPSLNVEFEMIDPRASKVIPFSNSLKIGDTFQLRITNKGTKNAFFQVIDIQPDDQISLLFDASKLSPNDLSIKAGETKLVANVEFTIGEPIGVEMFKLIASEKQLDLSVIATKQSATNRSSQSTEFEQLLNELYGKEQTRSANLFFSQINIFTRIFTIKEK
jgi:hypothetical protein